MHDSTTLQRPFTIRPGMSPTVTTSSNKLLLSHRTSSQDSCGDGIRKRVCKACDRCRLKKSKCDGSSPCSRCKADNTICVFGERKKSQDKVYPKGYVEMLEQQQAQLVAGLQEMYKRLQAADAWTGRPLSESNGHPLTHDILAALKLLEAKHDGSGMSETFEEDVQKLQHRLLAEGHGYMQRRGSISSESDHSQHAASTPVLAKPMFRDSFQFGSTTASPLVQSPVPQQRQPTMSARQQSPMPATFQHNDPQLYAPEWAQALSNASSHQPTFGFTSSHQQSEANADNLDIMTNQQWQQALDNSFGTYPQLANLEAMSDANALDSMDLDFSKFVNPTAAMEIYI